ncbi:SRPBCC family protein [Aquimarina algiphila]|uniref:SRPBCC family protein n=1 Tax=Aquimarina algiphila TaxID=2047982 RepID=A0A554VR07_9FLAO|nr:SRPBCC family protein [Aquimarina algiphila]TSE11054.1 SRPBCC family protein [Aquimarina algiphila]
MTTIHLTTKINAPIEKVFDLARSIDFHVESASKTKEKAISGRISGLIELNETVTWKGKHFGFYLKHQSLITAYNYPNHFTDQMVNGHFKSFRHQHIFNTTSSGTKMIDIIEYKVPLGFLGRILNSIAIKNHLTKFLLSRNRSIKLHLERKEI